MTTKKIGHHVRWYPRKSHADQRADSWLDSTTHTGSAQLPKGILGPYVLRADDGALWERLGTEAFFKLVANRSASIPEPVRQEAINRYLAGKNCTAIWACAKLCKAYLVARGITDETVRIH